MDKRWLAIAGAGLTLLAPWLLLHMSPDIEHEQSLCPHKLLTGLPCPGCGITKSLVLLYQGDLLGSMSYHLFGPIVVLGCIGVLVWMSTELFTRRRYLRSLLYSTPLAWYGAVFLGVYHVVRLCYFISTRSIHDILHESMWR